MTNTHQINAGRAKIGSVVSFILVGVLPTKIKPGSEDRTLASKRGHHVPADSGPTRVAT